MLPNAMEPEAHSILALPESFFRLLFRRVRKSVVKVEDRTDALYPNSRQGEPGHDVHARSREVQQEPEREIRNLRRKSIVAERITRLGKP